MDRGGPLRRVARVAAASIVGALVVGTADAVVWRHDAPAKAEFELADKADAVGQVSRGGLATLIARDWALTAAHVAQGLTDADRIRWGKREYAIKRVVIHPQGTPDPSRPRQPPEVDLALIELAERVEDVHPVMPNRDRDEVGQKLVIAGFGDFGPAGEPLAPADGMLRAVENVVADAGPLRLFLPFDAPPGGLPLEGIGAAGDSGGPALDYGPFFGMRLMGVSSGADGPPGQYGTVDVYTRVSSHIEWIESVAGGFREIEVVSRIAPSFPSKALRAGISGAVVIDFVVGVDGVPTDVKVFKSAPTDIFDPYAVAAIKRWRFKPRVEAGVAVPRKARQRLDFQIQYDR